MARRHFCPHCGGLIDPAAHGSVEYVAQAWDPAMRPGRQRRMGVFAHASCIDSGERVSLAPDYELELRAQMPVMHTQAERLKFVAAVLADNSDIDNTEVRRVFKKVKAEIEALIYGGVIYGPASNRPQPESTTTYLLSSDPSRPLRVAEIDGSGRG